MPLTEAWARCAAEKASLTKMSPSAASCATKPGSLRSSPGWKRVFSRHRISPGFMAFTAADACSPMQSSANATGRLSPWKGNYKFAIVVREAHTCASPTGLLWALVTERPVALPPVWLEEGSMSNADEYRQFTNDCIAWARIAISDDQCRAISRTRQKVDAGC